MIKRLFLLLSFCTMGFGVIKSEKITSCTELLTWPIGYYAPIKNAMRFPKEIPQSLRERFSSYFLLRSFLSLPIVEENPIKTDWESKVFEVNSGKQSTVEIGDINPGIPNFFEVKNIASPEVRLTSFASYPLLNHNLIYEASPEFKNHLALLYSRTFGSASAYSDEDTQFNDKALQAFKENLQKMRESGRLIEQIHAQENQLFEHLEAHQGKFDFLYAFNLSWYPNRVKLIEEIQQALKPGGKAYVLLKTRLKKKKVETVRLFNDRVHRSFLGVSFQISLAYYLASMYPDYFQIFRDYYADILIIKGNKTPLSLPNVDHVESIYSKTEFSFPAYLWHFF